jgi:hypothetical protein
LYKFSREFERSDLETILPGVKLPRDAHLIEKFTKSRNNLFKLILNNKEIQGHVFLLNHRKSYEQPISHSQIVSDGEKSMKNILSELTIKILSSRFNCKVSLILYDQGIKKLVLAENDKVENHVLFN